MTMPAAVQSSSVLTSQQRELSVHWFGTVPYATSHQSMMDYASSRSADHEDQIWLLEHPPVYTQGTACNLSTFVSSDIPVIKTDRGGQITYHGPGQIVLYPLLHLKNHGLGVKALVSALEQCVIDVLDDLDIAASRKDDAPGVYVAGAKIAALGLRIRRGNSYHGLSMNVDMDLQPFRNIDPCGYQGLRVEQLRALGAQLTPLAMGIRLAERFAQLI